jgi:hypothetical protein
MKRQAPLLPKGFGAKAPGPSSTSRSPDSSPGSERAAKAEMPAPMSESPFRPMSEWQRLWRVEREGERVTDNDPPNGSTPPSFPKEGALQLRATQRATQLQRQRY